MRQGLPRTELLESALDTEAAFSWGLSQNIGWHCSPVLPNQLGQKPKLRLP